MDNLANPALHKLSPSNDEKTKTLAEGYGAVALLDTMDAFNELVPAIVGLIAACG